ncbi:trypsin-like serine peptidase [Listeria riparia]|uniref:Glutamyl endopeptidase n=1 Tax=Listeria riparia FSL S10-1204 TaxID=1265816 RepID=W7D0G3_9LIST|nr:trypsin-like serine protease [Listeria riparia]EUJ45284.1 glutamyl endopeptidase [Listeria riparia FSL S10-1204]
MKMKGKGLSVLVVSLLSVGLLGVNAPLVSAQEYGQDSVVEISSQSDSSETEISSDTVESPMDSEYDSAKEAREAAVQAYNEEHPEEQVVNVEPKTANPLIQPRKIVGADNRIKANTSLSPFKQIGYLEMGFIEKGKMVWYGGTGTLVSGDTVLTAGHNVYDHGVKRWAEVVIFQPGMNNYAAPKAIASKKLYSMLGYTAKADINFDIGIVKLASSAGSTGFLPYKVPPLNASYDVLISGYPVDKPGSQWYHSGKAIVGNEKISYSVDTTGGQSGAPILNGNSIAGVHTRGLQGQANDGVRITPTFYNWITGIK